MDYTNDKGRFYKVEDAKSGKLITFGELRTGNILSTIHKVIFISEEEYLELI